MLVFYLFAWIFWSVLWGYATQSIIRNKGYYENWFWWGFFFGLIALLVALSKSENHSSGERGEEAVSLYEHYAAPGFTAGVQSSAARGWKCDCGRENPSYVSTCVCGKSKRDISPPEPVRRPRQTREPVGDEWKCTCGRINKSYVSTCACGKSRRDVLNPPKPQTAKEQSAEQLPPQRTAQETKPAGGPETELSRIEAIRKYKELLDEGILTQEEFEAKKKQLLRS